MNIETEIKQTKFRSPHQKVTVNIMFTNNWVCAAQNELLKPFGLTIQQYNVLRILRGQYPTPTTVSIIIERMMDKMSNASRLVDKLLVKNLVTRSECLNDRRAVDILITQRGLIVLEQIDLLQNEYEERLSEKLSTAEAEQLSELLDKIR